MFFKKKQKQQTTETTEQTETKEIVAIPSFVINHQETTEQTEIRDEIVDVEYEEWRETTDPALIKEVSEEEILNKYREKLKKEALELREELREELKEELAREVSEELEHAIRRDIEEEGLEDIKKQRKEAFKAIYGVETMREVLALFRTEYNRTKDKSLKNTIALFGRYTYAIYFMYSPSSIRNNIVKFKKVIKDEEGKYETNLLEMFDIDEVYEPIKAQDLAKKKALKKEIIEENAKCQDSSHIETTLNKIKELDRILKEKDYTVRSNQDEKRIRSYRIMALLALSTGRRFTELSKTLKLSKRGNNYYFTGLLKGNEERIEAHFIGLEYDTIKNYLKELRSDLNTAKMDISDVNKKYAKVFNNAFKRLGFTNIKSLRHKYAITASQIYRKEGEKVEDCITRLLGHKEMFSSSLNYT